MRFRWITLIVFAVIVFLASCSSDEMEPVIQPPTTSDCDGLTITYTSDIKAIMDASCATPACHSASNQANGIDLSTYAGVRSESLSGRFLGAIRHESGFSRMPQGGNKLSDAIISTIECWIENGSLE